MQQFRTRFFGLCLVPVSVMCLDCALTLAGQPTEYWSGTHSRPNEAIPFCYYLLARGPLAFIAGKTAFILDFVGIVLLAPRNSAVILSVFSLGNLSGPASWLLSQGYRYGAEIFYSVALFTVICMVFGIRWVWQTPEVATRLSFALRYSVILFLFVIWLALVFFNTHHDPVGSQLACVLPLVLFFAYSSYECFHKRVCQSAA